MADISIEQISDKDTWERFVCSHPPSIVLQSWNWGQFQKNLGRKVWYLGIFDDEELIGACLCYIIPTKLRTHLYTSNGPLLDWETGLPAAEKLLAYLRPLAKKNKAKFIRVDPLIIDTEDNRAKLRHLNLIMSTTNTQAENRWILDITPPEDALLANMRKNTRYAIRRSEKEGVLVKHSSTPKDFDKFWPIFIHTVEEQKFVPHSKQYYIRQIEAFGKDKQYRIYWAQQNKTVLAAALVPFYGDSAYYFHAASSDAVKNAFPAHALIWQVIRDAKAEGLSYFDFWGIAPTDDPKHPWAGFTFFKTGFGGFRQDVVRAHDLPLSPSYQAIRLLEKTRRSWSRAYYTFKNRSQQPKTPTANS